MARGPVRRPRPLCSTNAFVRRNTAAERARRTAAKRTELNLSVLGKHAPAEAQVERQRLLVCNRARDLHAAGPRKGRGRCCRRSQQGHAWCAQKPHYQLHCRGVCGNGWSEHLRLLGRAADDYGRARSRAISLRHAPRSAPALPLLLPRTGWPSGLLAGQRPSTHDAMARLAEVVGPERRACRASCSLPTGCAGVWAASVCVQRDGAACNKSLSHSFGPSGCRDRVPPQLPSQLQPNCITHFSSAASLLRSGLADQHRCLGPFLASWTWRLGHLSSVKPH